MRGLKRFIAVAAAFGAVFALTPTVSAQEAVEPKFSLGGTVFPKGSEFTVTIEEGTCPGGPVSIVSTGFWTFDAATLRGRFVLGEGTFDATLTCKDTTKTGTVRFELQDLPQTTPFLDKKQYAPGEAIKISLGWHFTCGPTVGSEGFAAPVQLRSAPGGGWYGEGKAVDAPGTYEVRIGCKYGSFLNTFTVKAPPTPTPPTTTQPPGPSPRPKPPVVKPKGAPDTGGGGTAPWK